MVPPIVSRIAQVALFLVGALVGTSGIVWFGYTVRFVATAKKTEGEIVRFEKVATKGGWTTAPVYAYRDTSGHRWEGQMGHSSHDYRIEEKIPVIYDPNAP